MTDMNVEKVYGLFTNFEDAASAVQELTLGGYPSQHITMIVNNADGRLDKYTVENLQDDAVDAEDGAGFGAVVGTLTALGVAVIPGVGPLLAAGPLAAALIAGIGAAAGAITGAAVGEMVEFDIDKEDAEHYAQVLRDGGALLVVDEYDKWDDDAIEDIMEKYSPVSVEDTD